MGETDWNLRFFDIPLRINLYSFEINIINKVTVILQNINKFNIL